MNTEKIWYASYGSNLNRNRFLHYILGGKHETTGKNHYGCMDKNIPFNEEVFKIPYELYFSQKCTPWENKGVAFIKSEKMQETETLCKLYLVTQDQFIDIVMQENGKDPNKDRFEIDFNELLNKQTFSIGNSDENRWYGRLIYIDEKNEHPIITFTAKWEDSEIRYETPGTLYLKTIIRGIKENFNLENRDGYNYDTTKILNYLKTKRGIKDKIDPHDLQKLINDPRLLRKNTFIVKRTKERFECDGYFVAQMHPDNMKNRYIPGQVATIINRKFGEELKVNARLQSNSRVGKNEIRIDQKIRMAIGVQPDTEVEVRQMSIYAQIMQLSFLERLLGMQINILRVKRATFTDMEIKICRISNKVMKTIGIEEGERIYVESVNKKIEIRALELTGAMEDKRRTIEQNDNDQFYPKAPLKRKLLIFGNRTENDLPWIFLDNDARKKLGLKPEDPVIVYRSTWYAVQNKLHLVSIPLILSIIGFIFSADKLFEKYEYSLEEIFLFKAGLFIFGLGLVYLLHLLTIRKRVK